MLSYAQVKDERVKFLACTSLTPSEFAHLLVPFTAAWQQHVEQRRTRPRQRQIGGGRKAVLYTPADKLFFILFYVKTYPLQEVMATIFGLSQSQVNQWIHRLAPLLQHALGAEQLLPSRDPQTLAQVLAACPTLEFLLDGTERRRQRPSDLEAQHRYYSGKKRRTPTRTSSSRRRPVSASSF